MQLLIERTIMTRHELPLSRTIVYEVASTKPSSEWRLPKMEPPRHQNVRAKLDSNSSYGGDKWFDRFSLLSSSHQLSYLVAALHNADDAY